MIEVPQATAATPADTSTVGDAYAWGVARLSAAGIDGARLDARVLLEAAIDQGHRVILASREKVLSVDAQSRYAAWIARRSAHEPVDRILGTREFWSLPFILGPDTLSPRPDSETLVEAALRLLDDDGGAYRVLDLGTGSGCLLLAVLSERPAAHGLGTDISPGAIATARANARVLGLADRATFSVTDWDDGISGPFDLILSNPPYIATPDLADLAPEVVAHDPRRALDGGGDGLAAIRRVAAAATRLLGGAGGRLVMEFGDGQEDAAAACLRNAGLRHQPAIPDLAGRPRCLVARADLGESGRSTGKY